jgi:acyl-CoA thioesterase
MTDHAFDAAIALEPQPDGSFLGRTSPDYANFIGPYGGLTAAQCLQAVMLHPQRVGEPVAFTVNFAAAVADGEFKVVARPARTNRSTQHWTVEMVQDGEAVTTATVMTAVRRETWGIDEAVMPQVPRPSDLPIDRARPIAWLQHYERRYVTGNIPPRWQDDDAGTSLTQLWIREQPERGLDFAALVAMADTFFPRLWLRRARQVPVGTVTITTYFHAGSDQLARCGTGYLFAQARGQGFRNGYLDHTGQLWNEAGELLATTTQLMYYKE